MIQNQKPTIQKRKWKQLTMSELVNQCETIGQAEDMYIKQREQRAQHPPEATKAKPGVIYPDPQNSLRQAKKISIADKSTNKP